MKLSTDPRLPQNEDVRALKQRLYEVHRDVANHINARVDDRAASAPTAGMFAVGDFVRNAAPSELGSAGSKYVITGWLCISSPLTFVPLRAQTGN